MFCSSFLYLNKKVYFVDIVFFQLQIPIRSVLKVSKEKTAKFIPNAVGLATADEKHVFGSLLSR